MRPPRSADQPLSVEKLEDRLTPTTGVPWLEGTSLTISFAPDGTDISGSPSTLSGELGGTAAPVWKREILRAFQTWAAQTNLNLGLVADGGQKFGVAGAPQEDNRFGDIRVGSRPLSADLSDSLAGSTGFSHAGGTWSGDVVLNSQFDFGIGHTATRHDLFTVVVQEAGNALSLTDNPTDKSSVMYPQYQGKAVTGLGGADVTAVRTLYGTRADDKYEGSAGNGTLASAYNLTSNGNITALSGDITRPGDADVYQFAAPATGTSKLSVELTAAGFSLFTGKVTVYDAANAVVGTAVTTDPTANNLSVAVAGYTPGATYRVKVEGADASVFSVGAYNLKLNYGTAVGTSVLNALTPYVNFEGWSANGTRSQAQSLSAVSSGNKSTFAVGGLLTSAADVDWFTFAPTAGGTLTLSVWALNNSLLPTVQVYDTAGNAMTTEVVANEGSLYTVQVANQGVGSTYYARVNAANPTGDQATGVYVLGTNLGTHPPTLYDSLNSGTLASTQTKSYADLNVGEARLTQFALSAGAGGGVDAAVRMTLFDAQGRKVFTLVAHAGQQTTTGAVWLPSGQYKVVYNAATRTGVALPSLAFTLRKWERSNPIDPYPIDPTSPPPPPPPGGHVSGTYPTPAVPPEPPGPVDDPYSNG